MATNEYNQEQTGMRSELDEPRRTSESTGFDQSESGAGGDSGYGGVSENEPPHHKIHSEDEPLPKPTSGTYDDDQFSTPSATGTGGNYGDDSTEKFQDSRSEQPQTGSYDETPETRNKSFGGEEKPSGGYSDPSSAFPGAPVDRSVEEPGYGQDTKAAEPYSTETGPESPTPKKEGFVQKLKDKLPGHKTSTPDSTVEDDTPVDSGTPKKGLMTKIKEKLPGHHSPTAPTTE
jgi:hypothetical protein